MKRRRLLKLGLGAAVLLGLAGGGVALLRPGWVDGKMSPGARRVMRAIARAVLDGSLPASAPDLDAALRLQLDQVDEAIAKFPPAVRAELSQLFALLSSAPGRWGLAALQTEWDSASLAELNQSLQAMRFSRLALRQQSYHALRDLNYAVYFAEPRHWVQIGYPGPKDIG